MIVRKMIRQLTSTIFKSGFASFGQGQFKPQFWASCNHLAQNSHLFVKQQLPTTYCGAPICPKLPRTYF